MPDLVEVIRCGDCKHFEGIANNEVYGYCYYWDFEQGMSPNTVGYDDYCSNGEGSQDT